MGLEKLEEKICPPWLHPLLRTEFFATCKLHFDSSKNECNMFCLDCSNGAICSSCLVYHRNHRAIQIRRSSYHDVIRVSEIHKFLDISGVQTYIINGARVVFLNERPQLRLGKGVTKTCAHCKRSLLDAFTFCSLGCKLVGTASRFDRKTMLDHLNLEDSRKQSELSYDGSFVVAYISPPKLTLRAVPTRSAKRRKGIPQRAPMGVRQV